MDEEEDAPPFRLQNTHANRRLRRQSSSLLFNSGILLIFLVLLVFALVSVVLPPLVSFSSQIFRPHLVKKGWDSLNLVLVLFAIVCGFLSRNASNDGGGDDGRSSYDGDYYKFSSTPKYGQLHRSNSSISRQWYEEYSDRTPNNRMRTSSSYPDLRLESSTVNGGDDRWRFYDDTRLYGTSRVPSFDQLYYRRRWQEQEEERGGYYGNLKDIGVDSGLANTESEQRDAESPPESSSAPPLEEPEPAKVQPPSPPPTPPPPKVLKRKPKRTFQDLAPKEKHTQPPPLPQPESPPVPRTLPPSSPPPPPPPPPPDSVSDKRGKNQKKRGSATKEFLISLRRKKKKQRQKSVENLDAFFSLDPPLSVPLYPPPPPPPPPPPLFQNIFSSKKSKDKKTQSGSASFSPPLEARASRTAAERVPLTTQKALLPATISSYSNAEESADSGNESPLIRIPPPPPPPPFKMPTWKFEVHGDFVRLKSFKSSRGSSPDLDEDEQTGETSPSHSRVGAADGGDPSTALFCPSPDVNAKADKFIERFRAGLKLEKVNSVNQMQRKGRSNLGPDRIQDPGPSSKT